MEVAMRRRHFIYNTGIGIMGLAAGCVSGPVDPPKADGGGGTGGTASDAGQAPAPDSGPQVCAETGADIEGPYYRPGIPVRDDLDLYGDEGEALIFAGTVTDQQCRPIENAVVEIWQANPSGDYDTQSDEKRYYAQVATDGSGAYAFKTLMPGRYLNGPTYRPAHIHMKVWVGNNLRLTTQIYFDGDPFNEADHWFDAARSVAVINGRSTFPVTV